jgi:FkbM family methyltransferase
VLRSLVPPGGTVVDIGANIGFVATALSRLVGPDGLVVAFEPSAQTFKKLQWTIDINRLSNVRAVNAGCGEREGTMELRNVTAESGHASVVGAGRVREKITLVRLDDVPELHDRLVDFIKIDTEGSEPNVLEGARQTIHASAPTLYLELGGHYRAPTLRSIELLRELGYDVRHVEKINWSQVGGGENFFFRPRA